jgi:hypothetical protein
MPITQKERIISRLHEFILQSEDQPDEEMGRRVAEYLVTIELLDNPSISTLFRDLQNEEPDLLKAVFFAGATLHALRSLGIVDLAASVAWYVGVTIRDTVAGDFVQDPTALSIVLRTLLTLIPYVDQVADLEDISANIIQALLHPQAKLTSPAWWFTMVCALVGMFPELGSAAVGIVKLGKKGAGHLAKRFLPSLPDVSSILPSAGKVKGAAADLAEMGRRGVMELLEKADEWRPVVRTQFHELISMLIDNLARLPAALSSKVAGALDSLRMMKRAADARIEAALDELLLALRGLLDELGLPEPQLALPGGQSGALLMEGRGGYRGRPGAREVVFELQELERIFSRVGDHADEIEELIKLGIGRGGRALDAASTRRIRELVGVLRAETFAEEANPLLYELYRAAERNVRPRAQLERFAGASGGIGQLHAEIRRLEDLEQSTGQDLGEEIAVLWEEIDVQRQVLQSTIGARGAYQLIEREMRGIAAQEGIDWPDDVVIHHLVPVHYAPELAADPANLLLVRSGPGESHGLIHQLLQGEDRNVWAGFNSDVLAEIQDALGL